MMKATAFSLLILSTFLFLPSKSDYPNTKLSDTTALITDRSRSDIFIALDDFTNTEVMVIDPMPLAPDVKIVSLTSVENNALPNNDNPPLAKTLNIGELMVLDKLFDNGDSLLDPNNTSLGDLFVLNKLFNQYDLNSPDNQYSLGDLFVLDELFDIGADNTLDHGFSSISDLLILDQLFND